MLQVQSLYDQFNKTFVYQAITNGRTKTTKAVRTSRARHFSADLVATKITAEKYEMLSNMWRQDGNS